MIIIIQEKDRALVEERFGSIVRYKQFIYKNSLYGLGITDYGAMLRLSESVAYTMIEMMYSLVDLFKEVARQFVNIVKPFADELSKLLPLIQPEAPPEKYLHPPEIHPPVMKIGKENTLPHVPKQKIYRNRNNC